MQAKNELESDVVEEGLSEPVKSRGHFPREIPPAPDFQTGALAIGSVSIPTRFFLAPLAGYTGLSYRLAVRGLGGMGLGTTDLINARSLLERRPQALDLAATEEADRPVAIQIFGPSVSEMSEAARRAVDLGATIIDINMGCPVRKVVRNQCGSALLCDIDGATRLVAAVVEAVRVPVTVKMRLGWDSEHLTAPELASELEKVGCAAVVVHGRTRAQGFRGAVDRAGIRRVVEAVERIPVVGNGDVRTLLEAHRMFVETGCQAISIGRGALGNPFIFRQLDNWSRHGDPGPEASFEERLQMFERHFFGLVSHRGERRACFQIRKTLRWYNYLIRPPKVFYHQLINLPSVAKFEAAVAEIRASGPITPLPSHFQPRVPVPSGPNERW